MADRVTLRQVADEAGVHTSTASRALNPETRGIVNADTVSKVIEVAERLGYHPHPMARGLRTNRTMTVGMVIPDVENPLFGPIIAGVEERLGSDGYSLLIVNTQPSAEASSPLIDTLMAGRVDGLIIATAARNDDELIRLTQRGVGVVLVNRFSDDRGLPAIVGDDDAGIGLAVKHLIDLGHRRIGHVAGPSSLSTGAGRRRAFERWTGELGLEHCPVEEAEWFRIEPGRAAAQRLLSDNPDLTAVVAANDLLALGVYRTLLDNGRVIGPDVSVTGYNDVPLMEFMQPPMTSVRVPYRKMGTQAAEVLLDVLRGGEVPIDLTPLPPSLSVRASTTSPGG